jgi:hypothetical protein
MCHSEFVDALLRASGQEGIFVKSQSTEVQPLELLWLPEDTSLEGAIKMASDARVFGLAEKGSSGKLAFCFRDVAVLSSFAKEKNLEDCSRFARWKVTGFPIASGLHGLHQLLSSTRWDEVDVLFLDERQGVFHSINKGDTAPVFYHMGGQPRQVRFKALNALARGMSQDARVQDRSQSSTAARTPDKRAQRQRAFLSKVSTEMQIETKPSNKRAGEKTGETPGPKAPRDN